MKKRLLYLFCFIFFLFSKESALGQQTKKNVDNIYRRHFLIYYDISYPFYSKEIDRNDLKKTIQTLFKNKEINNFSKDYLLKNEKLNGTKFFEPEKDQISFYYFGLNTSKRADLLRTNVNTKNTDDFYHSFLEKFVWKPEQTWSEYKSNGKNAEILDYINKLWSLQKPRWGNGISLSNLIYPLGIDAVKDSSYAEEYIIIILSDFLTGAEFGNKQDLDLLKKTFYSRLYYKDILSKYNQLVGKFYKIDYFNYEFDAGYENGKQNLLGIISYKIRPNTGKQTPDNTWLFLDSDVFLNQNSFRSNSFSLSPQNLKFAHNVDLEIDNIKITLSDKNDNLVSAKFLDYDKNFDKNQIPIYHFNEVNLNLNNIFSLNDTKGKLPLLIDYTFYTKYNLYKNSALNFAYKVHPRNVQLNSDNFTTETKTIIMTYILPLFGLVFLIYIYYYLGKPKKIIAELTKFTDSYETISREQGFGKLLTDFISAEQNERGFMESLKISGEILFRKNNIFPWSDVKITAELSSIEKKPEKLDIYLKRNTNFKRQYYVDEKMELKSIKNKFNFLIYFVNNDPLYKYDKPEEVKLNILIKTSDKRLFFIKANSEEKIITYHFQIGSELGDVWIGIDPGTSGTCIAAANTSENIIMAKNDNQEVDIMPSIISFNPDNNIGGEKFPNYPDNICRYGSKADRRSSKDIKFQSVKKLLGYKDKKVVKFKDEEISLSGKQLTALLINGAFKGLNEYISKNRINFDSSQIFNPKRAVVAVPNNFTITKILDMINSFDDVLNINGKSQFDEIRYIYEAEAILFNYISEYPKYNTKVLKEENILIFDMGGATINVTIVNASTYFDEYEQINYKSNIIGKLGYGIGGDTIDYVLVKILFENTKDIPVLNNYLKEVFDNNQPKDYEKRTNLKKMTLELKKAIIKNKENNKDYILNPTELSTVIKNELKIEVSFKDNTEILNLLNFKEYIKTKTSKLDESFKNGSETDEDVYKKDIKALKKKLKNNNSTTLLNHPIFEKYILSNVRSAVSDVFDLSGTTIDTVIFSGRSVFFPMIKETVLELESLKNVKIISLSFTDSKTAVVKGACWYGVNKSRIKLNNIKTNGVFGFKHTDTGTLGKFISLIDFGTKFNSSFTTPVATGGKKISSDFGLDNNYVEFYQIMGKNAPEILNDKELSHKRNKLARIRADNRVNEVSMSIYVNDKVDCRIKLETGRVNKANNIISDMEIAKENEEHYTWYIK